MSYYRFLCGRAGGSIKESIIVTVVHVNIIIIIIIINVLIKVTLNEIHCRGTLQSQSHLLRLSEPGCRHMPSHGNVSVL